MRLLSKEEGTSLGRQKQQIFSEGSINAWIYGWMDECLDGCVNEYKNAMSEARVSIRRNKKKAFSYILTGEGNGPYSSTLAWKIPWTEEPGRLQSMGLLRVRHNWATSLSLFTFMHWRRKWQPTPVILPGESQGRGSLMGGRLWGRTESDTTEVT